MNIIDKFQSILNYNNPILLSSGQTNDYTLLLRKDKGTKLTIDEMDNNFLYVSNLSHGTPSRIAYFDDNGKLNSNSNLLHNDNGDTLISNIKWMPNKSYNGTLNDNIITYGKFNGPTSSTYTITITSIGSSPSSIEEISWVSNNGTSASNIAIDNDIELEYGLFIYFSDDTPHQLGDEWLLNFVPIQTISTNGDIFGEFTGVGNIMIDDTNGVISIDALGDINGNSNGTILGLVNPYNNSSSFIRNVSLNNNTFEMNLTVSKGSSYSTISLTNNSISFQFDTGNVIIPSINSQGVMVNDGDGNLYYQDGLYGTYSIGSNVLTLVNGIITNIN